MTLAPTYRGEDPNPVSVSEYVVERARSPVHKHKPDHIERYSEAVKEFSRGRPRRGGHRVRLPHL